MNNLTVVTPGQDLVPSQYAPREERSPYEPRSLPEAMELAKTLSSSSILPKHLIGKPGDVLATMIKGKELGLTVMQSVSGMHVINGKVELDAATLAGIVMRHSDVCEYLSLTESTDTKATYETKRRGSPGPVSMSFTIDDAKRAGLLRNEVWAKYPAAMLRARAASQISRAVYPDIAAGLYVTGELTEGSAPTPYPEVKKAIFKTIEKKEVITEPAKVEVVDDYENSDFPEMAEKQSESGEEALARIESDLEFVGIAQEAKPDYSGFVAPFGKSKGRKLTETPVSDLTWLARVVSDGIRDPSKQNFRTKNEELLEAIKWAMKERK